MKITKAIACKVLETVDAGLVKGLGSPQPGQMCVEAAVNYAMGLPFGDDPPCVSPVLRAFKIGLNDSQWSSDAARAKGLRRLAVAQLGSAGVLDNNEFVKRLAKLTVQTIVPSALRAAASLQKDAHHKAALLEAADFCEKEGTNEAAFAAKNAAFAAKNAAFAAFANVAKNAAADAARYAAFAAGYAAKNAAADAARYAAFAASDAASDATSDAAKNAAFAASAARNAAFVAGDAVGYAVSAAAKNAAFAARAAKNAAGHAVSAAFAAGYAASAASDKILADFAENVVQLLISMDAPGIKWLKLTEAVA